MNKPPPDLDFAAYADWAEAEIATLQTINDGNSILIKNALADIDKLQADRRQLRRESEALIEAHVALSRIVKAAGTSTDVWKFANDALRKIEELTQ